MDFLLLFSIGLGQVFGPHVGWVVTIFSRVGCYILWVTVVLILYYTWLCSFETQYCISHVLLIKAQSSHKCFDFISHSWYVSQEVVVLLKVYGEYRHINQCLYFPCLESKQISLYACSKKVDLESKLLCIYIEMTIISIVF